MKASSVIVRWLVCGRVLMRLLLYPSLVAFSIWTIAGVARVGSDFRYSPVYGPIVLAAALSALMVALIRIGDGQFQVRDGKNRRLGAQYGVGLWTTSFIAISAAALAFALADRLPNPLQWPSATNVVPIGDNQASAQVSNAPNAGPG